MKEDRGVADRVTVSTHTGRRVCELAAMRAEIARLKSPRASSASPWLQSASGNQVWLREPGRARVDIYDVAKSLACQCRFAGHLRDGVWHYSVAEHSVRCSWYVEPEHALAALLHDAHEAYLHDLTSPWKLAFATAEIAAYDVAWQDKVWSDLGAGGPAPRMIPGVKRVDVRMLATEQRDLMAPPPADWQLGAEPFPGRIEPLTAEQACSAFLARYDVLRHYDGCPARSQEDDL